jgi:hypothetical protein
VSAETKAFSDRAKEFVLEATRRGWVNAGRGHHARSEPCGDCQVELAKLFDEFAGGEGRER